MGRGSSGIKQSSSARKLAAALRSVEDRIRGNPTESAIALDENGNILFDTSDGKNTEVSFTMHQQRMAYGKTLTHNHPHGYYFSEEDLYVADTLSLKSIRATTPDGRTFVLEKIDGANHDMKALRNDYGRRRFATAGFATQLVYDPSLSRQQLQHLSTLEHTRIMNEWLAKNATKYGYKFREEKGR